MNSPRICVILCYYGPLPKFYPFFLDSCFRNSGVDFQIYSDAYAKRKVDRNVTFVPSSLDDFNKRASDGFGFEVKLPRAFKICDFRPAFGDIFKEELNGYDFWGFCDMDIILGQVRDFITDDVLKNDVISTKPKWVSGSFSLYRNSEKVNGLYRSFEGWERIFRDTKYWSFDECGQRWYKQPESPETRLQNGEIPSMYDVVSQKSKSGELNVYFGNLVKEWEEDITHFSYSDEGFVEVAINQTFMYFHLLLVKRSWRFYIPPVSIVPRRYEISGLGIWSATDSVGSPSLKWRIDRAISCARGITKSLMKKAGL